MDNRMVQFGDENIMRILFSMLLTLEFQGKTTQLYIAIMLHYTCIKKATSKQVPTA